MQANDEGGLWSPSDIADIAGVSRAAVSNWRKRMADFPEPVAGTPDKPLFAKDAITAWMDRNNREFKPVAGERAAWSAMNLLRGEGFDVDVQASIILSLCCLRKIHSETGSGAWPQLTKSSDHVGEIRDVWFRALADLERIGVDPGSRPDISAHSLMALAEVIETLEPAELATVADALLERVTRSRGKAGVAGVVGSPLSVLLGSLAASQDWRVLYDPACGIGEALVQAVVQGEQRGPVIGHEVSSWAESVARQRAYLRDLDFTIVAADALVEDPNPDLKADLIVAEPPFGMRFDPSTALTDPRFQFGTPPASSADTAWLQHVVAHLLEGGWAYVILPAGSLYRGGRERDIRAELIRRGCLKAIVLLPAGMAAHTGIQLALWVLQRPSQTTGSDEVLLVDASDHKRPERHVAGWLTSQDARAAVPHVTVTRVDLITAESNLTPARWLEPDEPSPREILVAFRNGLDAMRLAADRLAVDAAVPPYIFVPEARIVTLGELIDQKMVDMRAGRPKARYEDLDPADQGRMVTAAHVKDGLPEFVPATPLDLADLTQPGDVLVTTMNHVRARVDDAGGRIPSTGVHRLRIRSFELLDPQYLATVLTGSWNERFQGGSTIQRAAIRDLEIPLVPVAYQADLRGAIGALMGVRNDATKLAEAANEVREALLDALRYRVNLTLDTDGGEG